MPGDHEGRSCEGLRRRLRSRARRRQHPAAPARLGAGLRRLVQLQISQRRPRMRRRMLCPRASCQRLGSPALCWLVGTRPGHALPDGPEFQAHAAGGRLAAEQSADFVASCASRFDGDLPRSRNGKPSRRRVSRSPAILSSCSTSSARPHSQSSRHANRPDVAHSSRFVFSETAVPFATSSRKKESCATGASLISCVSRRCRSTTPSPTFTSSWSGSLALLAE